MLYEVITDNEGRQRIFLLLKTLLYPAPADLPEKLTQELREKKFGGGFACPRCRSPKVILNGRVRGKIPGASGDEQFRIYVVLRPDAVATLEKSREFRRGADNTVYHKGYPINYRQQGGVPSMSACRSSMATDT